MQASFRIAKNVYKLLQYTLKNSSFPECIYVYFLWQVEWLKAILKIKKSPGNSFYYVYNSGKQVFVLQKVSCKSAKLAYFSFKTSLYGKNIT